MTTILDLFVGQLNSIATFIWKRYFSRPELTIEIINTHCLSIPCGLSENFETENRFVNGNLKIRVFELTWQFQIIITNNSEMTAYYPELSFCQNGPELQLKNKLNLFNPIMPCKTIILNAEYRKTEEKTGQQRTDVVNEIPEEFEKLKILLAYKSSHKCKFYTDFDFAKKTNKFTKKKPNSYKSIKL